MGENSADEGHINIHHIHTVEEMGPEGVSILYNNVLTYHNGFMESIVSVTIFGELARLCEAGNHGVKMPGRDNVTEILEQDWATDTDFEHLGFITHPQVEQRVATDADFICIPEIPTRFRIAQNFVYNSYCFY